MTHALAWQFAGAIGAIRFIIQDAVTYSVSLAKTSLRRRSQLHQFKHIDVLSSAVYLSALLVAAGFCQPMSSFGAAEAVVLLLVHVDINLTDERGIANVLV